MHKNGNYNYAHNSTLSCHYRNNWSKCFTPQAFLKLQCKSKTSQARTKHSSRRQSPDAVSSSQDFWYRSLLNSHDSFTKKKSCLLWRVRRKGDESPFVDGKSLLLIRTQSRNRLQFHFENGQVPYFSAFCAWLLITGCIKSTYCLFLKIMEIRRGRSNRLDRQLNNYPPTFRLTSHHSQGLEKCFEKEVEKYYWPKLP